MPIEEEDLSNLDNSFVEAAKEAALPPTDASPSPQGGSAVPPPADPPTVSPVFQAAGEYGFDTSQYKSDEELVKGLFGKLKEVSPYVDYARQILPHDEQIREYLRQSQQPRQQPQQPATQPKAEEQWDPDKYFGEKWGAAKYDKAWDAFLQSGMIQLDPRTGHYVPVPEYSNMVPLPVLQGLNEYRVWQKNGLEKLLANPYKDTWDAFQEPMQRLVRDEIKRSLGQYDDTQSLTGWESQNARILYEHDQAGNIAFDIYGNPKTTEYGSAFIRAAQGLRQSGVVDPRQIIEYAGQLAAPFLPKQQPSAAPQQPQPPAPPQKKPESFMQQAMHRASSGGYAEAEDVNQYVQSSRELDNMFMDAALKEGVVNRKG